MLRHIPEQSFFHIASKEKYYSIPTSVDTSCPYCGKKVNFTIVWLNPANYHVEYSNSHCPACQARVTFLYVADILPMNTQYIGNLFIKPGGDSRVPLQGVQAATNIPEALKNAYFSTINVLNAREWVATSVLCRRVLEGITQILVSEDHRRKPLATQLQQLPNQVDLSKPILTLADAIRKGGNLGAHFDLVKQPNQEISTLMVDLLDDLIEYLFVLPDRIQQLHDKIESLSASENKDKES